jgi:hypothetical protein
VLVLGAPRALHLNRWKDDITEAGELLGWDMTHIPARDVPVDDVVRQAKGCDILLWGRTHGHDPVGDVDAMLRRVEDAGVATVALHLDLYWGIGRREAQIGVHPWWSCQYVFTADGGRRDWAGRGVNHFWCPPAMGHRFFGRGTQRRQYLHKAVFVGGLVRDIHGYHRSGLLRWARQHWGGGFQQYGVGRRARWGQDLSDLYASAGVAVGDSAAAPHYWSDRLPITLGRGGLLAHPVTPGMAGQGFTDEVMVLYDRWDYRGLGKACDAITPARRRQLTDNALTLVSERHMWSHRLLEIERVVCGS